MARQQPAGPPPAPIVQRLTIRYAKRGRMRFASHRDVARAIERGVRKAGVPIAYSAGFSPHPRISYAGGAPTGSASEAEYLELSLARRCEPAEVGRRLDAALPDGIDVVEVDEVDGRSAGLALEASEWEVVWPGIAPDAAASAAAAFLARPAAVVERLTAKGVRRIDARAAMLSLSVVASAEAVTSRDVLAAAEDSGEATVCSGGQRRAGTGQSAGCAILRMIVRQMTPAVRPDDILAAIAQSAGAESAALAPGSPAVATRLWQGPLSGVAAVQAGMTVGIEAAEPGRLPAPVPSVVSAEQPRPDHHGAESPEPRPVQTRPGRTTDKAMLLEAESAGSAPASQARANDQLPRGTRGQVAAPRAREPYGRDCPDARNRATEPTVRSQ